MMVAILFTDSEFSSKDTGLVPVPASVVSIVTDAEGARTIPFLETHEQSSSVIRRWLRLGVDRYGIDPISGMMSLVIFARQFPNALQHWLYVQDGSVFGDFGRRDETWSPEDPLRVTFILRGPRNMNAKTIEWVETASYEITFDRSWIVEAKQ